MAYDLCGRYKGEKERPMVRYDIVVDRFLRFNNIVLSQQVSIRGKKKYIVREYVWFFSTTIDRCFNMFYWFFEVSKVVL